MPDPLTVHNAEIKTAAVEVKTLTISGKQVTQSVFRQLLEEPMTLADGRLAGTPWGRINYHPGKCGDGQADALPAHRHVVWQKDTELRRARVDQPSWNPDDPNDAFYSTRWADPFIAAAYCRNGHTEPQWLIHDYGYNSGYHQRGRKKTLYRYTFRMACPDGSELLCGAKAELDRYARHECASESRFSSLFKNMTAAAAGEEKRRERLFEAWEMVLGLPHLFIAV
jgi:hypothetical protein